MSDEPIFEDEQLDLLTSLVEAARKVPRDKRGKFMFIKTFGGAGVSHPGLPEWSLDAYKGDIEILGQEGLLSLSYGSRGTLQFDVTPRAFKFYDQLKRQDENETNKPERLATQLYGLDQPLKEILKDILNATQLSGAGVDAICYRAEHDEQLALLDKLEQRGLLRKELDKYWVSLYGLTFLDDEKSQALKENFEKIYSEVKALYKSNPKDKVMAADLARVSGLTYKETAECLGYMTQAYWLGGYTTSFCDPFEAYIQPSEEILRHKNFKEISAEVGRSQAKQGTRLTQLLPKLSSSTFPQGSFKEAQSQSHSGSLRSRKKVEEAKNMVLSSGKVWRDIESDYDISKRAFGNKIRFVVDAFQRKVIFRDIEQAYVLANEGFPKPAVILAGSVIEELLRLFLEHKKITPTEKKFDSYIKACADNGLLKSAIHRLTDSVRHFRNLVHLQNESSQKHTISKATAKGAVASIFTIVNDFQQS